VAAHISATVLLHAVGWAPSCSPGSQDSNGTNPIAWSGKVVEVRGGARKVRRRPVTGHISTTRPPPGVGSAPFDASRSQQSMDTDPIAWGGPVVEIRDEKGGFGAFSAYNGPQLHHTPTPRRGVGTVRRAVIPGVSRCRPHRVGWARGGDTGWPKW
jgi:hypothetical protein